MFNSEVLHRIGIILYYIVAYLYVKVIALIILYVTYTYISLLIVKCVGIGIVSNE